MHWLRNLPFLRSKAKAPAAFPTIDRARIAHLIRYEEGFPHLDWHMADRWMQRESIPGEEGGRAVAAAWLDEVRDAAERHSPDYRRWRHPHIEGLAPAAIAPRTAKAGDESLKIISKALARVLGQLEPPELGILVFADKDQYISFTCAFHPEEGEWATSGGCYHNEGGVSLPLIITHAGSKWSLEMTIAHEMTHHLLEPFNLPLWVEEGFTQMMEERVTGYDNFKLDREMLERHRERWDDEGIASFLEGDAFYSGHDTDQELAYHLAQWIARTELSEQPEAYFRFVRDCAKLGPAESALKHLNQSPEDLIAHRLGLA